MTKVRRRRRRRRGLAKKIGCGKQGGDRENKWAAESKRGDTERLFIIIQEKRKRWRCIWSRWFGSYLGHLLGYGASLSPQPGTVDCPEFSSHFRYFWGIETRGNRGVAKSKSEPRPEWIYRNDFVDSDWSAPASETLS